MKNIKTHFLIKLLIIILTLNTSKTLYSQQKVRVYPKIKGYVGALHPLITFTKEKTTTNFKDYYIVGMPIGINIWKNKTTGFSFEFVPTIKSDKQISKVNNILIHPGVLVRLKNDITFAGRIAFETSGRYGFTPIITKTITVNEDYNYFVSVPMPVRFGNNQPNSLSLGLQFGIAF